MKFSTVALGVSDLRNAERFHVEGLGFAVDARVSEDLVYLASGPTRIALYPAAALAAYAGTDRDAPGGVVLSLNLDSAAGVDAVFERAVRCGGIALRPPGEMDWGGYAGTLRSPDGHVWEVVWAA